MPKYAIDIDEEKGAILGDVPEPLQRIFKQIQTEHHNVGYGKGVEKAAEDAKKQITETVASEKAKWDAQQPLEKEKLQRLEADHKTLETRLSEMTRESARILESRAEAHAKEITARAEQLAARNKRIQALTRSELSMLAAKHGAREESMDELGLVLDHYIGYTDDSMEPFVKNPDGTQLLSQGKPITLDAFVQDYLTKHPHHRKPAGGRGGDARRGASLGGPASDLTVEQARQRITDEGDRSPGAINALFEAGRKKAS